MRAAASTASRSAPRRWREPPFRSTAPSWPNASASRRIAENSLDAVSDRDFAIEFTAAAALLMTHVSRLAEELVLWMSPRFGFVRLPDRFTTGSSIMPQKKNPDVPELARGKTGRVNGHLVALLTLMKGQPLAYNKDNQEDKEPLFDTVDTVLDTLRAFVEMVPGLEVDAAAMRRAAAEGYSTATDLADYLVRKGLPFREAHEAVARAVQGGGAAWRRTGGPAARRAARSFRPVDRGRRAAGADARRFGGCAQPSWRDGAGPGAAAGRALATSAGRIARKQEPSPRIPRYIDPGAPSDRAGETAHEWICWRCRAPSTR